MLRFRFIVGKIFHASFGLSRHSFLIRNELIFIFSEFFFRGHKVLKVAGGQQDKLDPRYNGIKCLTLSSHALALNNALNNGKFAARDNTRPRL